MENLEIPTTLIDLIKALAAIGFGGGAMSLLTSALVASSWPSRAKEVIAFLCCLAGSFLMVLMMGVDMTNLVIVVPLMIISCQVFYRMWFKPTGIAPWIETLFINDKS